MALSAVTLPITFLFVTKLIKQAFMEPLTHSLVVSGVRRLFTRYASAPSTVIWFPFCWLSKNLRGIFTRPDSPTIGFLFLRITNSIFGLLGAIFG